MKMELRVYKLMAFGKMVFFILLLNGCATVDHSGYFQAYEERYRAETDYRLHQLPRDGFKIHAREYGVESHKPTLVMMHGFPDSMHLYDRLVPLLAKHRHIITFDFLGWGDSDKPEQHRYDVASLRRDLEAVIDHFSLNQVVLVMHDASGQPGIDWALDNPLKSSGLVLLNTYYASSPTLKAPEAIKRFSTPGLYRDLSVWATSHFDSLWMQGYNQQIAKFISTDALREPFQKILGYQSLQIRPAFFSLNRVLNEEIEKRQEKIPALQRLQTPVRIIFGNDDTDLNAGVAKDFHQLLPNSEIHLIEGAGHFVQIDKPSVVASLIRDFPSSDGAGR
ncbi:MAG: alpha/beta hydrolase [Candidatus Thiodiazotropha lotti]|uniref:Alpha/beta hydrolase n=1 Tax=Candidatus Thiodiazotropha lotti TaxID=2792787 RepID=A0A9E4K422_9GAMM|nr:alpha/beta hydrolase [Candidatus Thiodiazotropha lotti]MCG7938618.1 alpha/beta hydrolase [Candidatus Thiodiazotropha lotti]MCW4203090.1 alpha/beta hydrolase [Candidatus Thiodiazotropha lotti]MCW4220945.1 alpha/beta hydrolase [Candidatus Thiodiazotropha lotti]